MFEDFIWDDGNEGFGGELVIWEKNTKVVIVSDEEPFDKKTMLSYQTDIEKKLDFLGNNKAEVAKLILNDDYVSENSYLIGKRNKEFCDLIYIKVCFIEVSAEGTEIYMIVGTTEVVLEEFGVSIDADNGIVCEGLV